jgi:hypothetical protein
MSKGKKFKVGDRVEVRGFNKTWDGLGVVESITATRDDELLIRFDREPYGKGYFDTSYVHKMPLGVTYE